MTFVDGSTVINADKMNGIVSKINELVTAINNGSSTPVQETVATPSISISGSTATITCATAGATIYYTTNGNTPTSSSTSGTSPVTVNLTQSCTIKAVAMKSGMTNSSVASQSYTAPSVSVASPTMSLNAGKLTLACATAGATIYYTLDGSTPTSSSTQYQSAITLTESCTIKAIAVKSGSSSSVTTKTYSRTSLHVGAWSDNYLISSTGQASSTSTNYPGVFSIGKNASALPSDVTHLYYTRIILTTEDPDGYVAFYSGTSGTMSASNCVGTPVALPKTASEHGTYDTASIEIPEGAERFRIPFWTSLKESADIWYESLS